MKRRSVKMSDELYKMAQDKSVDLFDSVDFSAYVRMLIKRDNEPIDDRLRQWNETNGIVAEVACWNLSNDTIKANVAKWAENKGLTITQEDVNNIVKRMENKR